MMFNELLALVSSSNCPGIGVDSRLVKDGDIFVAVKGTIYDGHDFIDQAIANGAKYIVCQQQKERWGRDDGRGTRQEIIVVKDSAEAAALLAQASRANPASKLVNLAVTGTNGKTTVAYLVRSCIRAAGQKCGLIGTIEYDTGSTSSQAVLTTPDCLTIAESQQQMVKAGSRYMVIEASSHALSQNRLAGIDFKAAAFTNLAGDHMDYHKTREDYLAAKTKLFSALSPDSTAVLNKSATGGPEAKYIAEKTRAKILWYAIDKPADITAHIESMDINGTVFVLKYHNSRATSHESRVKTPLLGRYNVSNHLAAAGLCLAAGFDLETIAAGLSALQVIAGRLEKIEWESLAAENAEGRTHVKRGAKYLAPQSFDPAQDRFIAGSELTVKEGDFSVLVDYAHTDDALKNVLATLKPLCKGKLIVVFGCGGDRDRTKRPRMARVAEELADIIIVTSDNPRTERPENIIDEIVAGFSRVTGYGSQATSITIEPDRRKAIELAIKAAGEDDIVLIAGKGHENYQIIGTQKFHFSDKAIAEQLLRKQE